LRGFLFSKGFEMGKVDKTLFLLRQGDDVLIVQVYVDDIVFGGSSHSLVARFVEDMSKEYEMSMMGYLQFFLGVQIKQAKEGTFVHQAKYMKDILKKFRLDASKPLSTLMSTTTALNADEDRELVD
jgi:hypoxanthine phosphoribosyltransferase